MIGPTYMKVNFQTPTSGFVEMIRRGNTRHIPAWFNLLGNVELPYVNWGEEAASYGPELPTVDISQIEKSDKIVGYIDDTHGREYFGRIVLDIPLTYYAFAQRDAKNYSILYHDDQFHEAVHKLRGDDLASRWLKPDTNYQFAWAYLGTNKKWYRLIDLPRHQRTYALDPKIPYTERDSVDHWEARIEVLHFPYEPKPFYCFACKKEHMEGFDVVLSNMVDNTRNFQGITYQYDGSEFQSVKNAKILFLTQFCSSCFSAFRMLGLMTPEKA